MEAGARHKRAKVRLDELVLARGLADTRSKAQALILAGRVLVNDAPLDKPGTRVAADAALRLRGEPRRYVSRGGEKLAGALADLLISAAGKRCLDVGASTGGFTDCLLQRGATRVYAFDVGTNQMVWKLRSDPRVICREGFNVRHMHAADVPEQADILVADVSFISLTLVLPGALQALKPSGQGVVLIKPQFELSRTEVGRGGIVRDAQSHQKACDKIRAFIETQTSFAWRGLVESVIQGTDGNREFLAWFGPPDQITTKD